MIPIIRSWIDRYFHNEEAVLLLVLLFFFFVIIWFMGNDLGPVLVAVIISFLLQGVFIWLKQRGAPHLLAVVLSLLLLIGMVLSVLLFVLPILWDQLTRLSTELPGMIAQGRELLLLLPEKYPMLINQEQIEQFIRHSSNELATIGQHVLSLSLANIPILFYIFLYLILVPLLVFFFLKDGVHILSWIGGMLPKERPVMSKIWAEMNQQIANYVRGKVVEIIVVGAASYLCFVVLGLKYAMLLGIVVGLSVVVPYIGAVVVTFPVLLIGYFQWGFGYDLTVLAIAYLVIQGLDGNLLVPLLFSEAVKLHPVAIIMAVLVFGGLWGFWGVFFAIPLATLVKAIGNAWPTRIALEVDEPSVDEPSIEDL